MTVIDTEGLTRRFGDVLAVDSLDLTVEGGEVFGFLGPNGAGKSTTINVLLGFLDPTAGRATVLGTDVTERASAVRRRVGLLPEGFEPYRNLTGREHVQSAVETKGVDDDPDALLDRVGLDTGDADRAASEYSTGMTRRLGLAIALVGDPDLLVLDEPSSGLDPNGVKRLRRIVREERDRGATVFFSSHVLDEVEKVCDRVGILNEGRLVAVDEIDDLREQLELGATVEATLDRVPEDLAVADLEDVRGATVDGATVRVACDRPEAKMRALRYLDERATVTDIAVEDASLEAVFDEVTGADDDTTGDSGTGGAALDGGTDDGATGDGPDRESDVVTATGGDS